MKVLTNIQFDETSKSESIMEINQTYFDEDGMNIFSGFRVYSCDRIDRQEYSKIVDGLVKTGFVDLSDYVFLDSDYTEKIKEERKHGENLGVDTSMTNESDMERQGVRSSLEMENSTNNSVMPAVTFVVLAAFVCLMLTLVII